MKTRAFAKGCVLAAGVMVAAGLSGCYERTVSAKGLGANSTTVQEGYRSDTALDRAWDSMFSDPREAKPVPKNSGVTPR